MHDVRLANQIIENVTFKNMDHKVMRELGYFERRRLIGAWRNDVRHVNPSVVINGFLKMDAVKVTSKAEHFVSEEVLRKYLQVKMDGMLKHDAVEAYRYGVNESWKKKKRA